MSVDDKAEVSARVPWFDKVFAALCLASLGVLVATGLDADSRFYFAWHCFGGDAITYYYAAMGAYDGISPYDNPAIEARFGEYTRFVYPIYSLPLFLPLIAFDLQTALVLYNLGQIAALTGMLLIIRPLLPIDWRLLALLLPVGFGGTTVQNYCPANTVLFEAFFLWLGIRLLWHRRSRGFALAITAAALPKILWLTLLPLLLHRSIANWRPMLAVGVAGVAAMGTWLVVSQETFSQWISNLRITTGFRHNVFTALRKLDETLGGEVGGPYLERWETWGYALWVAVVVSCVLLALKRRVSLRTLSLLAPMSLLAIWPGNLAYSWVPLLPIAAAVIFFFADHGRTWVALTLAVIFLLPQATFVMLGFDKAYPQGTMATVLVMWAALATIALRQSAQFEAWLLRRL